MRIAQVAPLFEPIPPPGYGGTERIVSVLTEELVRRGHDVTLFATGDSATSARLIAGSRTGLRRLIETPHPGRRVSLEVAYHLAELGEVRRRLSEFDVIHSHLDSLAFPLGASIGRPFVSTTHGRLDLPDIRMVYRAYPTIPLVSISSSQQSYLPEANWLGTVSNAIDLDRYTWQPKPGSYLAFLGRFSPEKGPDQAIELAIRTGLPIKLAAKVDPQEVDYYEAVIEPLLKHPLVEYIGEIGDAEKSEFLGGALAYLFPIDWPEPFGITLIEALACGTPVIARRRGAVPEIVEDGLTGFIGETLDDLERAIGRVHEIDRSLCRRRVEKSFSASNLADGYEQIYRDLVAGSAGLFEGNWAPSADLLPPSNHDHQATLIAH